MRINTLTCTATFISLQETLSDIMTDEMLVIGVLGRQGVGKSTVLNLLTDPQYCPGGIKNTHKHQKQAALLFKYCNFITFGNIICAVLLFLTGKVNLFVHANSFNCERSNKQPTK